MDRWPFKGLSTKSSLRILPVTVADVLDACASLRIDKFDDFETKSFMVFLASSRLQVLSLIYFTLDLFSTEPVSLNFLTKVFHNASRSIGTFILKVSH